MGAIEMLAHALRRKDAKRRADAGGNARDRPGNSKKPLRYRTFRNWTRASYSLSNSEMVYAAVARISSALATMPVRLYKGFKPMPDDPRHRLLALSPNDWMSAYDFKRAMEANRNVEGRAYALKVYAQDGMTLHSLHILDPTRVRPIILEDTGELWYEIVRPVTGEIDYVHNYYVLSLRHMSTNGVDGLRPLDVLRGTLDYDAKIRRISLDYLQGVQSGIILEFPTEMDDLRRKEAIKEFYDIYVESEGNLMALDAGVKATTLTRSAVDPQLFDAERISRSRIAMVYMIPPHMLGDYSDSEFGNVEDFNLEFITFTMLSIVEQWQQELDRKLLTTEEITEGWHFRFDVNAIQRANMTTVAECNFKAVRSGWKSPDEIRAEDFLPPVVGGDKPLVSKDLARLEDVARGLTLAQDHSNRKE